MESYFAGRRGALRDYRSCLFRHVPRVVGLCQTRFKRAQVHKLVENVASMDFQDCQVMNEASDELPWHIDSLGVSLCRRLPLCWVSWQLLSGDGVDMTWGTTGQLPLQGEVVLQANLDPKRYA